MQTVIFAPAALVSMSRQWDEVPNALARRHPTTGPLTDGAKSEVLVLVNFSREHWRRIWPITP